MRINFIVIALLLASCSETSGPVVPFLSPYKVEIQQGNLVTPEMREKIQIGMSSAMVRSILGTPLVTDPFHANRWDYVYTLQKDGKPAGRQRLTLYFADDHLSRIDDSNMSAEPASDAKAEQGK